MNRFLLVHLLAWRLRLRRHVTGCGVCMLSPRSCLLREQIELVIAAREAGMKEVQ